MKPAAPEPGPDLQPGLHHPGRWLWLLFLIPVLAGLVRLRFDVEIFDLLPAQVPAVKGLKLYQRHFASGRELIVAVQAPDADLCEQAARTIAGRLRLLTNDLAGVTWQAPWLEHPGQLGELLAYIWFNQPPEIFRDLTNRLAPEKLNEVLARTRDDLASSVSPEEIARLSYDPFGFTRLPESVAGAAPSWSQAQDLFGSKDGTFRILFVQPAQELKTYRDCQDWLDRIKADTMASLGGEGKLAGVNLGFTGRPAFMAEVAAGMQHDITFSVGGTAIIIAALFWLAHRRWKPMFWLLALLAVILAFTLALGGLIYGAINVVSMGFAAILLGLAVDYAVVHYQEALAQPALSIPQIRRAIAPSIFWAAVTTIAAFLMLNFGGLPGLNQLGTLVGLGVGLAALIMIFEFLPPLFPERRHGPRPADGAALPEPERSPATSLSPAKGAQSGAEADGVQRFVVFGATWALLAIALCTLALGLPGIDTTANALKPERSAAYATMDLVQARLTERRDPLWLVIAGTNEMEVASRFEAVRPVLGQAVSNGLIADFTLPTPLWPRAEFQAQNQAAALRLGESVSMFRSAALTSGFSEEALGLTERMLATWREAGTASAVFWPTNPLSRWVLEKFAAKTGSQCFAAGMLTPAAGLSGKSTTALLGLGDELAQGQAWLSGWELLGWSILREVKTNLWKVVAPMVGLVGLSLLLAFRRASEILLSIGALLLSGLCLLTVMRLAHWSWNLLNLMAIPLVLGTGVDYSIFMQLALRRHEGDLRMAYRSVGRALLLCGGTAVAGFGSLAWSSNAGMASLGRVCAVGIGCNMLIAIFLLPRWWKRLSVAKAVGLAGNSPSPARPSSLYRPELWRLGMAVARRVPRPVCETMARSAMRIYWVLAGHRREVVIRNLMPALKNDRAAARNVAKALYGQFGVKLVDLFRYEAGLPITDMFGKTTGWENFTHARSQRRGILLLTPHLGNWEFGGPLLRRKGEALQVITLAEPGRRFTELRQEGRARWNIETVVIRDDPLAFLEVVRRLERGAVVALLVDRPPKPTAVEVELFGQPFSASIAAAELARASGCVLLPVYLPRKGNVYEAHILPPVPYEREELRDRRARAQLTQRILRTFEPLIREHLDQWYHFVPVWAGGAATACAQRQPRPADNSCRSRQNG